MEVGIPRDYIFVNNSIPSSEGSTPSFDPEGEVQIWIAMGDNSGVVKFVPAQHFPHLEQRVFPLYQKLHIAVPLGPLAHLQVHGKNAGHGVTLALMKQAPAEIDHAAALGEDRHARRLAKVASIEARSAEFRAMQVSRD